jgi:hypothetical protein
LLLDPYTPMLDNDKIENLGHVAFLQRRADTSLRILQLTDMHLFPTAHKTWVVEAKGGRVVNFEKEGECQSVLVPLPAKYT